MMAGCAASLGAVDICGHLSSLTVIAVGSRSCPSTAFAFTQQFPSVFAMFNEVVRDAPTDSEGRLITLPNVTFIELGRILIEGLGNSESDTGIQPAK